MLRQPSADVPSDSTALSWDGVSLCITVPPAGGRGCVYLTRLLVERHVLPAGIGDALCQVPTLATSVTAKWHFCVSGNAITLSLPNLCCAGVELKSHMWDADV